MAGFVISTGEKTARSPYALAARACAAAMHRNASEARANMLSLLTYDLRTRNPTDPVM